MSNPPLRVTGRALNRSRNDRRCRSHTRGRQDSRRPPAATSGGASVASPPSPTPAPTIPSPSLSSQPPAGWLFTYYNSKKTDERKAQIERVNAQVGQLYGPLLACVHASRSAYAAMVRQHSPDGTVQGFVNAMQEHPEGPEGEAYRCAGAGAGWVQGGLPPCLAAALLLPCRQPCIPAATLPGAVLPAITFPSRVPSCCRPVAVLLPSCFCSACRPPATPGPSPMRQLCARATALTPPGLPAALLFLSVPQALDGGCAAAPE